MAQDGPSNCDGKQPKTAGGLRAAKAVARERGISDTTIWRWERRAWITTVNISGKKYVCLRSLGEFDRRAAAGEFAKPPAGAAANSAAQRAAKKVLNQNEASSALPGSTPTREEAKCSAREPHCEH